jgi:lipopolysaccharide/colanic/teichoic acid biosynthesis glycosyltransferase
MYYHILKRLLDILISALSLVFLGWFIIIIAICLLFANKGTGVFFLQERPGKDNKLFKIIKFKTMTDEKDSEGNLLPDDKRLTDIGRFLRSTSFDELPQLVNVLKGDMSLVGPRPPLVEFLPFYSIEQSRRHTVRPGMTGWAQVNGRNTVTYSKKFEYDVWYVDHLSFKLDARILWMTIINVLKREGIGDDMYDEADDLGWNRFINKK